MVTLNFVFNIPRNENAESFTQQSETDRMKFLSYRQKLVRGGGIR